MSDFIFNYSAAADIKIVVKRGCSVSITTIFYDNNGAAENLTDWTARMMIKDKAGGDTWLNLYNGSGITITPGTGTVDWVITPTQTRTMPGKHGVYDCLLRNSDGSEIICPMAGEIVFEDVVSDAPPST